MMYIWWFDLYFSIELRVQANPNSLSPSDFTIICFTGVAMTDNKEKDWKLIRNEYKWQRSSSLPWLHVHGASGTLHIHSRSSAFVLNVIETIWQYFYQWLLSSDVTDSGLTIFSCIYVCRNVLGLRSGLLSLSHFLTYRHRLASFSARKTQLQPHDLSVICFIRASAASLPARWGDLIRDAQAPVSGLPGSHRGIYNNWASSQRRKEVKEYQTKYSPGSPQPQTQHWAFCCSTPAATDSAATGNKNKMRADKVSCGPLLRTFTELNDLIGSRIERKLSLPLTFFFSVVLMRWNVLKRLGAVSYLPGCLTWERLVTIQTDWIVRLRMVLRGSKWIRS